MASEVLSFRVPEEVHERFERRCEDEGLTTSKKLRQLVEGACQAGDTEQGVVIQPPDNSDGDWETRFSGLTARVESLERLTGQMDAALSKVIDMVGDIRERLDGTADTSEKAPDKDSKIEVPVQPEKPKSEFPIDFSSMFEKRG
jgi:hypothetical protein